MPQKTKASKKTRYSRRQTCARSYQIKSKFLGSNRLLGFTQTPTTPRQDPSAEQLGADYTAWLRKNFAWLFNQQNSNNSRLGTAYVYGDAELGQHSLLGEYGNGDAKGKGRTEYIWLPIEGAQAIAVGVYKNGKVQLQSAWLSAGDSLAYGGHLAYRYAQDDSFGGVQYETGTPELVAVGFGSALQDILLV